MLTNHIHATQMLILSSAVLSQLTCHELKSWYKGLGDESASCCDKEKDQLAARPPECERVSFDELKAKEKLFLTSYKGSEPYVESVQEISYKYVDGRTRDNLGLGPRWGYSSGEKGQVAFDADYAYVATEDNEWKRLELETFVAPDKMSGLPAVKCPYSKFVIFGAEEDSAEASDGAASYHTNNRNRWARRIGGGPLYSDYLSYMLGCRKLPVSAFRGGYNYASRYAPLFWENVNIGGQGAFGNAEHMPDLGPADFPDKFFEGFSMQQQMEYYMLNDRGVDKDAIFLLGTGKYYQPIQSRFQAVTQEGSIELIVDELVENGAETIVVFDQGSILTSLSNRLMAAIVNHYEQPLLASSYPQVKAFGRSQDAILYIEHFGKLATVEDESMIYFDSKKRFFSNAFMQLLAKDIHHQLEGKVDVIPPVRLTWSQKAIDYLKDNNVTTTLSEGDDIVDDSPEMLKMKEYAIELDTVDNYKTHIFDYWFARMLYIIDPSMVMVKKYEHNPPKLIMTGVFDNRNWRYDKTQPNPSDFYRQYGFSNHFNGFLFTALDDIPDMGLFGFAITSNPIDNNRTENSKAAAPNGFHQSVNNPFGYVQEPEFMFPSSMSAKKGEHFLVSRYSRTSVDQWFGEDCALNITRYVPPKNDFHHLYISKAGGNEAKHVFNPTKILHGGLKRSIQREVQRVGTAEVFENEAYSIFHRKAAILTSGSVSQYFNKEEWTFLNPTSWKNGPLPMFPGVCDANWPTDYTWIAQERPPPLTYLTNYSQFIIHSPPPPSPSPPDSR